MARSWKIYGLMFFSAVVMHLTGCMSETDQDAGHGTISPLSVIKSDGVAVPVYNFEALEPILDRMNDSVYVINFWATWCKPCIKELPYFLAADSAFAGHPVRIVLVSLDFVENVKDKLIPFMIDRGINAEVVLLDDLDANSWIPHVDPYWEGDIPATLFIKNGKRIFMPGSLTYEELTHQINHLLNK